MGLGAHISQVFLGGLTNLRGYSYEEVGSPTGGKSYVFGRMELEVPLKGSFVFVPFYDVGGWESLPTDYQEI